MVSRIGSAVAGAARAIGHAVTGTPVTIVALQLPTTPGRSDYCFVFDLDEVFDKLHRSVSLRPRFEVWTADGVVSDRDHLGRELWVNFVHQYEEERDAAFDARFSDMETLETEIDALEERHTKVTREREGLSVCATWVLSMLGLIFVLMSIPLVLFSPAAGIPLLITGALLAWWASRRARKWKRLLEEEKELEKQRKDVQRRYNKIEEQLHSEMKRVESAFNLTNGRYQNGSFDIAVMRHPQIAALGRDIFSLEEMPPEPESKIEEELTAPDIYPYLRTDFYKRWVPDDLEPRIDAWTTKDTSEQAVRRYHSDIRSLEFLGSVE